MARFCQDCGNRLEFIGSSPYSTGECVYGCHSCDLTWFVKNPNGVEGSARKSGSLQSFLDNKKNRKKSGKISFF